MVCRLAKGEDTVVRVMDKTTCDILDKYIRLRGIPVDPSEFLFVKRGGRAVTIEYMAAMFRGYRTQLKWPPGVGWHSLRRGLTTWLYEAGMREKEIQDLMGWKSPEMPGRYIKLVDTKLAEKAARINPLGG